MKQPINIENRKLNKKIIEDFLIKEGFKKVTGIGEKYKHKKYKNLSVFLKIDLICSRYDEYVEIQYVISKIRYATNIPINIYRSLDRTKLEIQNAMLWCGVNK